MDYRDKIAEFELDGLLDEAENIEKHIYDLLADMVANANKKDCAINTSSVIITVINKLDSIINELCERVDSCMIEINRLKGNLKEKTNYLEEGREELKKFNLAHSNSSCWSCDKYKNDNCDCNKCYSCTEDAKECRGCRKLEFEEFNKVEELKNADASEGPVTEELTGEELLGLMNDIIKEPTSFKDLLEKDKSDPNSPFNKEFSQIVKDFVAGNN